MSERGMVEVGSRHDLRVRRSPHAPETDGFEGTENTIGWIHSYETGSTVDGPGVRVVVFMSGCLLRCQYCHNPDTWHLKDGTQIVLSHAIRRLHDFAPALRAMGGGLTITGGEPLVQAAIRGGCWPPPNACVYTLPSKHPVSSATGPMTATWPTSISSFSTSRAVTRNFIVG